MLVVRGTASLTLEISQRREDHKGYDNLDFLSYIAEFLETEVKKIRSDKPKPEYRLRTTNLKGNIKAKNYLLPSIWGKTFRFIRLNGSSRYV